MRDIRKFGSSAFYAVVAALVVGILIENAVLLRQNRTLKSPEIDEVHAGQRFVNLSGVALDGKVQSIALPVEASQHLVIFTFSPGCPFCQKSQPFWAELAKDLRQRGVKVLWVSRDPVAVTNEYCRRVQIPVSNVVADPPNSTFKQLGLQAVPDTIVVGPGGMVEKVWTGAVDSDKSATVFGYFGISYDSARSTGLATDVTDRGSAACCSVSSK